MKTMSRAAAIAALTVSACTEYPVEAPEPPSAPPPEALAFARAISAPINGQVYIAFAAGDLRDPLDARFRNLRSGTGAPMTHYFVDGALDPVAIPAAVGDTLEMDIARVDGSFVHVRAVVPNARWLRVIRMTPGHGRVGVDPGAKVRAVFSEPVEASSVSVATFSLNRNGVALDGTVVVAQDRLSAEFVPAVRLAGNSSHTLVVTTDLLSLSGNPLERSAVMIFSTLMPTGVLAISTTTTGADYPSAGYQVLVGATSRTVRSTDRIHMTVEEGAHVISLVVPSNCSVNSGVGGVTVIPDDTLAVDVRVECRLAGPPLQGTLAFVSRRDGGPEIYSASLGAGAPTVIRLTNSTAWSEDPAWSPDGSRIAFSACYPGWCEPVLTVMDADGTNVGARGIVIGLQPAWSSDGALIGVTDPWAGIMAVSGTSNGGPVTTLVPGSMAPSQPAWSPDGTQLAFVGNNNNIFVAAANGASPIRRTTPSGDASVQPAWSPDGRRIAYVNLVPLAASAGQRLRMRVFTMSADGSDRVEHAWAGDVSATLTEAFALAWSPDGATLAFTFVDCDVNSGRCPDTRSIRYVRLATGQQGTLIDDAHSPAWKN